MPVKRVYIFRSDDSAGVSERLKKLQVFIDGGHMPEDVSLRAYRSSEDDGLLLESWMYPDAEAEADSAAVLADLLAEVRPASSSSEHSYAAGLGMLSDRNSVFWND